jgi:O-antigen/teichoic acid export membrane protein
LLIAAVFSLKVHQLIWPEQTTVFIMMGAGWAFLTFCVMILTDMSDAYALTIRSEMINMALKILGAVIVLLLFFKNWLSLRNYFTYQLIFLAFSVVFLTIMIQKSGYYSLSLRSLSRSQVRKYFDEFSSFCFPLLVFTAVSMIAQIGDRWFIQKFSGSAEQGFYAFAYQIGSVCFLFTSAVIPLVLREQAICFGQKDLEKLKVVFLRSSKILYVITAFFCCFIAVQAQNVLMVFGGKAYEQALIPLIIMCFYPIHQTFGQINSNFFFATSRVKIYRNIGLIFVGLGLLLTFFLLGPIKFGCLEAGATGLAIKMVFLQILSVNVQLWSNTAFLKLSFRDLFFYQLIIILLFSSISMVFLFAAQKITSNSVLGIFIAGVGYTCSILLLLFKRPELFSLEKSDVLNFLVLTKAKVRVFLGKGCRRDAA